jgi:hypothetical protein
MSKNNIFNHFKLEGQEYVEDLTSKTPEASDASVEEEEDKVPATATVETDEEGNEIKVEGNSRIGADTTGTEEEDTEEGEDGAGEASKTPAATPAATDEDKETFTPFISHLADESILIVDKDKKYDDSLEGFANIVKDTVEVKLNEKIESLPEDIKRLVKLGKEGVNVKELLKIEEQEVDFTKVDIADVDNQKNLILDHLLLTGHNEEEANELLENYKDANLLEKQAKIAVKILGEAQTKRKAAFIEAEKAKTKALEDKRREDSEGFKNKVLSTTKIGTIEIPKAEATKLYDYMTKPVKEGKTQYELDGNEDNRLMLAYLMMNKFDTTKLEKKVETKKTKEIKQALTRYKDKSATVQTSAKAPEEEKPSIKLPKLTWI